MKFFIILISGFILIFCSPSFGNEKSEIEALAQRLYSINSETEDKCKETWDILWSGFKNGNMAARANLLILLTPYPHADAIRMPGYPDTNHYRDVSIVSFYSIGDHYSNERLYGDVSENIYINHHAFIFLQDEALQMAFPEPESQKFFKEEKFLRCLATMGMANASTKLCAENSLMPTLEEYILEIENNIAKGLEPKCSFHQPRLHK